MKYGFRKPSLKKSIKASTTGKLKRKIKKTIDPTYGVKGTGIIKDPKKAMYNKVYNKTTVDTRQLLRGNAKVTSKTVNTNNANNANNATYTIAAEPKSKITVLILCLLLGFLGIHRFYVGKTGTGLLYLITGGLFLIGWIVDLLVISSGSFTDSAGNKLV